MKELIIFDPLKDDLQDALRHARLVQVIGVIVTDPSQLTVAHEFDVEILPMFGRPEQALKTAQDILEASDSAVVVMEKTDEPHRLVGPASE